MTRRIAACQFEPTLGNLETNYEQIHSLAEQADADLAVFPELCVTGYDLTTVRDHAVTVPGDLTDPLVSIAACTDTELIVGLPERHDDTVYNAFVLIDDDGVQSIYRKSHPWGDESTAFGTGAGPVVAETSVGRVGFLLCYDLNFPELALAYADAGCDVLAVGSAWRRSFEHDWRLLCRSRALDGTCYMVGSNHVGSQSGRHHAGGSLIAGPRGNVITQADDGAEAVTTSVSDKDLTDARRKNPVRAAREKADSNDRI